MKVWPVALVCILTEFAIVGVLYGAIALDTSGTASKIGTAPVVATLGRVITVDEHSTDPFDAVPGDTVNVHMSAEGDPAARCSHMGGTMHGSLCMDVDF